MRFPQTAFTELVGVRYPVVQAPMAGANTPELVAAVSNAGGLGSLGAALLGPDEIREKVGRIRELTNRPFAVNLFAWEDDPERVGSAWSSMVAALRPHREALGVPDPPAEPPAAPRVARFKEQLAAVVELRVPVFSFTFGVPDLSAIHASGAISIGTATTVAEAQALEAAGVHAITAQGTEAGGHQGAFLREPGDSRVGLFALLPQVVDRVGVPVLAAGGIMDGRGIAAALTLGAAAAQIGTAFLVSDESAAPEAHKRTLASTPAEKTAMTDVMTGRPARMVRTPLIGEIDDSGLEIPPMPLQGQLTRPLHAASAERDEPERMYMLTGQGGPMARPLPAAELFERLIAETEAALKR